MQGLALAVCDKRNCRIGDSDNLLSRTKIIGFLSKPLTSDDGFFLAWYPPAKAIIKIILVRLSWVFVLAARIAI